MTRIELVDVIAEGMPIDRGRAVVVVKAQANRVVVREADGGVSAAGSDC